MFKDKRNLAMLGLIILSIILISVTIFALNREIEPVVEEVEREPEIVHVGIEHGEILSNFTREDAVGQLVDLLISIGEDPLEEETEDSIMTRLERLDDEETDIEEILTEETLEMLYLSKEFEEIKFNRQFTASSLLIYHEIVKDGNEDADFQPVIDVYDEIVYLDSQLMTAHIPLDIFIGSGTGIAFEMQYIDGEWKMNPYTAMMSLNLMGILNESVEE